MRKTLITVVAGLAVLAISCGKPSTQQPAGQSAQLPSATSSDSQLSVPAGTKLKVRTQATISTRSAESGNRFKGTLIEPLQSGDRIVAGRGAEIVLHVVDSNPGGRVRGLAHLTLRVTGLKVEGGKMMEIQTDPLTRQAHATKSRDAAKIGIAGGVGAAIGAIAGGGKGAAIGAGAGGAAGTGVVLATHGEPAEIPAESAIEFRLRNPIVVN